MTTIYFGTKQPFSGWNFLQPFQFEHFQKVDPLEILAEPGGLPDFDQTWRELLHGQKRQLSLSSSQHLKGKSLMRTKFMKIKLSYLNNQLREETSLAVNLKLKKSLTNFPILSPAQPCRIDSLMTTVSRRLPHPPHKTYGGWRKDWKICQ